MLVWGSKLTWLLFGWSKLTLFCVWAGNDLILVYGSKMTWFSVGMKLT